MSEPTPSPVRAHGVWWIVAFTTTALGLVIARETVGQFGAGDVVLRGWMVTSSAVVLATQTLVLLALAKTTPSRWATAAFIVGAAAAIGHLALPFVVGTGPWAPGAAPLVALWALTFTPSVAMDLGGLLVALTRVRAQRSASILTALAFAMSVILSVWLWIETPQAVMGRLHALAVTPLWCAAPLLARALLAVALLKARR